MDRRNNIKNIIWNKFKNRRVRAALKRTVSLLVTFALILTAVPIVNFKDDGDINVKFGLFEATEQKVEAANVSPYNPHIRATKGEVTITKYDDLLQYASGQMSVDGEQGYHPEDTINLTISDISMTIVSDFQGIGTSANPFAGTLKIMDGNSGTGGDSSRVSFQAPLFNYISESARICDASNNPCAIALSSGGTSTPLFANHVIGCAKDTESAENNEDTTENTVSSGNIEDAGNTVSSGNIEDIGNTETAANWKFILNGGGVSGGIFGTIGSSSLPADIDITVIDNTNGNTISSSGNAGVISMEIYPAVMILLSAIVSPRFLIAFQNFISRRGAILLWRN